MFIFPLVRLRWITRCDKVDRLYWRMTEKRLNAPVDQDNHCFYRLEYQRFIYFRRINKKAQRKYPEKESWKIFADFSSPLRLQSYAFKSYNKIFSQINFIKLLGNFFFSASPKSFPFQPLLEGCIGISLAIIQLVEEGAKFPVFAWSKRFFLYATTLLTFPHSGLAT